MLLARAGLAATLLALAAACSHPVDRYFVRSAVLSSVGASREGAEHAWKQDDHRFALAGHVIASGGAVVLSKRQYFRGKFGVTDHEGFTKLSIVLPTIDSPRTFDVAKDKISVIYSAGVSAFPKQACFSYGESGTVDVAPRGASTVVARIAIRTHASEEAEGCGGRSIIDEATFKEVPASELTPWLGAPFESLDEASFR